MKVYTKTGDKGETGLVGGARVSKSDIRLETYGDVDELNSHLGSLVSLLKQSPEHKKALGMLEMVQSALFTLGSNLASEKACREKFKLPKLSQDLIRTLEEHIDHYEKSLEPLKNFILPNGSQAATAAHVARSVCRRVERRFVSFTLEMPAETPEHGLELLNRLSDYLFVLSRHINKVENETETIWRP